ncbi:MAG: TetR/AcrR family transcriptional regulator [Intrasporangiaceae bacterium]|nr:TetR/AcrR family transcriptional regulator [Intrasporangiaceae bacterium]
MSTGQALGNSRSPRLPRSARRAQLLEAAQSVFAGAGYHSSGMDDIADRAGVSKPVLYQHFPGKLDLYLALLDQHCGTLESLVRDALHTPAESAKSRVFATIEAYFDFVSREDAAFRMVFESDLTSEPAQVSARHWLAQGSTIPKHVAAHLVGQLAWRGVSGFPTGMPENPALVVAGEESTGAAG